MVRAIKSSGPAGVTGTMMRTGLVGHCCAVAGAMVSVATDAPTANAHLNVLCINVLLCYTVLPVLVLIAGYRPLNTGLRFSLNAATASA